jgi:hypothetical protein
MAATPTDTVKRKAIRANLRDPYKRAPNKAQYWPQASTGAREQLDELRSWLLTHSSDLPSEIENEKGQTSSRTTYEIPEALVRKAEHDKAKGQAAIFQMGTRTFTVSEQDDFNTGDVVSKYERHGRFHLERSGCNAPYDAVLNDIVKSEKCADRREYLRAHPTSREVRALVLDKRGARYAKYAEAQATRLRWRGMEEWDAVGKASEKLEEGLARTPSDSNAKPLPSIDSLQAQFEAIDGVLYRKRLNRPVTGRKVKIDGELYAPSRVAFAVMYGQDPGSLMVRDGVATKYRGASGFVSSRSDGQFDAEVKLEGTTTNIGEYATKRQAEEACSIYLQTLERWG